MKRTIIATLSILTVLLGGAACSVEEPNDRTHASKVVEAEAAEAQADAEAAPAEPEVEVEPVEEEPVYSVAQENAIASASDYLDTMAFSKTGLIEQLKFEDFSQADARFAVNHIAVNWRKQAAASAAEYLDSQAFSRQGLVEQLVFEGFTPAQAEFGVSKTGL